MAKLFDYAPHTVMRSCGAALANADSSAGQVDIIIDDNKMVVRNLEPVYKVDNGKAGVVHIGFGLGNDNFFAVNSALAVDSSEAGARKCRARAFRKHIHGHKSNIMPGLCVIPSGIAQSYN